MFRSLNLHLFAGLILSILSSALAGILYTLILILFIPFQGGGVIIGALPFVIGIVTMVSFISTLLGFFLVMTARLWGADFKEESEGLWVYSIAAMSGNLWLISDFQNDLSLHYLGNMALSVVLIIAGNKFIYSKIREKLNRSLQV